MPDVVDSSYFQSAKKLALKEYSKSTSNGEVGYLPSLEGLIKNSDIVSEVNLGVIEIPLKKIIGTYSHLRSLSFAKNFMPLLDKQSEFQTKWTLLYNVQLNQGIRDSIKVYEYLNWFYVIEGNKRVSVLKYFNAYSINAEVIRLLPQKNENDMSIRLYYEFLKFNKLTNIHSIWLSKESYYEDLLPLLEDYTPPTSTFKSKYTYFEVEIYQAFREIYLAFGGQKLQITTGDALLEYIKIYGLPEILNQNDLQAQMKEFIIELQAMCNETPVDVLTSPIENSQNKVITALTTLVIPKKSLKIAFIYARTIKDSGWTYAHELGRLHLEAVFGDSVTTDYIENVPEDDTAFEIMKVLVEEGNDIIFTTSPVYLNTTLKCALEFPLVKFFNCSEANPYQHVTSYYGRTYEPRFLTGIIAGSMTKNNIIGYVANTPTHETLSSINAFALGAKMVNPYLKIKVSWTGEWNNRARYSAEGNKLIKMGADIICNRSIDVSHPVSLDYGVYSMLCTIDMEKGVPDKYLATPIWQWGIYYEKIVNNILNDTFKTITDMFSNNTKLVNFWWGIDAGVVDIFYSKELVPPDTQKLVNLMKRMITDNTFHPFTGPIYDQAKTLRVDYDETASNEQILNMDWLVDTVETEIPEIKKG
ncbi:MAG: BMP family ABC transporter substrate-binding protein [Clostridiaceae bacterium]|nr:BMP family ABC transporter substrate-binding protein [Clostridiaceae bacterium]